MTSTRNNNLPSNYYLQQRYNSLAKNYQLYPNSANGSAYNPAIPSLGYMPSHMSKNVFSNNPVDIESALLGINSSNLVEPQNPVVPELKDIKMQEFFETLPTIMPYPLIIEEKQRPFPIPQ